MREKGKAARVAWYGMLTALAMILSFVELLIPINFGIPGVKLGLANLVTVVGLYTIGGKGTAVVVLVRILLTGLTFGNTFSMMYSMAGGLLSLSTMVILKKTGWFDTVMVSVMGGVAHNIGQLLIAAWVVDSMSVFYYLPFLMLSGILAGALIGLLGGVLIRRFVRFLGGNRQS